MYWCFLLQIWWWNNIPLSSQRNDIDSYFPAKATIWSEYKSKIVPKVHQTAYAPDCKPGLSLYSSRQIITTGQLRCISELLIVCLLLIDIVINITGSTQNPLIIFLWLTHQEMPLSEMMSLQSIGEYSQTVMQSTIQNGIHHNIAVPALSQRFWKINICCDNKHVFTRRMCIGKYLHRNFKHVQVSTDDFWVDAYQSHVKFWGKPIWLWF